MRRKIKRRENHQKKGKEKNHQTKKLNSKLFEVIKEISELPFKFEDPTYMIEEGWGRVDFHIKNTPIRISIMTINPFEENSKEKFIKEGDPFVATAKCKTRKIKRR